MINGVKMDVKVGALKNVSLILLNLKIVYFQTLILITMEKEDPLQLYKIQNQMNILNYL